jgi:PhnB protein
MTGGGLKQEKAMDLNTYLGFDGNCAAAFKFYEKVLGGKILMMMSYGDMPGCAEMPADTKTKIAHMRMQLGDKLLMGSDAPHGRYEKPAGFNVNISVYDPAQADRLFAALSENGTVTMPIQETFWAARFGMLVDQFGTPWMINCEKTAAKSATAA